MQQLQMQQLQMQQMQHQLQMQARAQEQQQQLQHQQLQVAREAAAAAQETARQYKRLADTMLHRPEEAMPSAVGVVCMHLMGPRPRTDSLAARWSLGCALPLRPGAAPWDAGDNRDGR
jgi:hypothetical protein